MANKNDLPFQLSQSQAAGLNETALPKIVDEFINQEIGLCILSAPGPGETGQAHNQVWA